MVERMLRQRQPGSCSTIQPAIDASRALISKTKRHGFGPAPETPGALEDQWPPSLPRKHFAPERRSWSKRDGRLGGHSLNQLFVGHDPIVSSRQYSVDPLQQEWMGEGDRFGNCSCGHRVCSSSSLHRRSTRLIVRLLQDDWGRHICLLALHL